MTRAAQTLAPLAPQPEIANFADDQIWGITTEASSGLPVYASSDTPSVCSLHLGVLTVLSPGICTYTASQPGYENYEAAPTVSDGFTIGRKLQTITFADLTPATFTPGGATLLNVSTSSLTEPVS